MSSQRLQKVLAQAGVSSRRAAEQLITEGRVRVNGRIVRELGSRADPKRDRVEVDGRRLVAERLVYYLLHKPRGVVTTLDDPEGRKSITDLLRNVDQRVFPVGRLDFQTSGALLLTNDGALAQGLLHPTHVVPKMYHAKLQGQVDGPRLEALREGVVLDDGQKTAPAVVNVLRSDGKDGKYTSLEITIAEGKNRQIHRMGDAIGRTVLRLSRISFAGLTLEGLRPGEMRALNALELAELKQKYVGDGLRRKRALQPRESREVDVEQLETFVEEAPEASAAEPTGPKMLRARKVPARGFTGEDPGASRRVGARGEGPRRGRALNTRGPRRDDGPRRDGAFKTTGPRRDDTRGPAPRRDSALAATSPRRGSALKSTGPRREEDARHADPRRTNPRKAASPRRDDDTRTAAPRRDTTVARRDDARQTKGPRRDPAQQTTGTRQLDARRPPPRKSADGRSKRADARDPGAHTRTRNTRVHRTR